MRLLILVLAATTLTASTARGADIPAPETAPPPSQAPAEPSKPEITPSPTDPGMVT